MKNLKFTKPEVTLNNVTHRIIDKIRYRGKQEVF